MENNNWEENLGQHWSIICSNESNLKAYIKSILSDQEARIRKETILAVLDILKDYKVKSQPLCEQNTLLFSIIERIKNI